ncbi:Selenide, water dikinase isoform 1 [Schistosoma japonicum]|nr:Selenide, water dikinase isoform 1 [Schistosoma japonicum]TNN17580.1 Selenide, water dikinase isoform 1 [Schistosoma japonicum]
MGRITCCNVLSDLYAMGVVDCDNLLLLLGIPREMTQDEREISTRLLIEGFKDCALEAGTYIRGGQTVLSPWLMVGGVATSVCNDLEYIMPDQAAVGDVLVLTKPLGTQVAVSVYYWMLEESPSWSGNLCNVITSDEVKSLFHTATLSMTHLNRPAARLMHKHHAHGCTDVTGFGLLGHANNLVQVQANNHLAFSIHTLPCFEGSSLISKTLNDRLKLLQGLSPETSGGLLIVLPRESAQPFCEELTAETGCPSWIIGDVVEAGSKSAFLVDQVEIVDVRHSQIVPPKCSNSQ